MYCHCGFYHVFTKEVKSQAGLDPWVFNHGNIHNTNFDGFVGIGIVTPIATLHLYDDRAEETLKGAKRPRPECDLRFSNDISGITSGDGFQIRYIDIHATIENYETGSIKLLQKGDVIAKNTGFELNSDGNINIVCGGLISTIFDDYTRHIIGYNSSLGSFIGSGSSLLNIADGTNYQKLGTGPVIIHQEGFTGEKGITIRNSSAGEIAFEVQLSSIPYSRIYTDGRLFTKNRICIGGNTESFGNAVLDISPTSGSQNLISLNNGGTHRTTLWYSEGGSIYWNMDGIDHIKFNNYGGLDINTNGYAQWNRAVLVNTPSAADAGYIYALESIVDGDSKLRILCNGTLVSESFIEAKQFYIFNDDSGNRVINFHVNNNGEVKARKVTVNLDTWSDFVFESGYPLMSINEVENYIAVHKHLPGVPSKSEVTENGVDVAEMDKILLQKIEELTLYIIELEKKIIEVEHNK